MARLSISLLGSFQATLGGAPIANFKANKARALLAYLAVEAHRHPEGHPRTVLAGLLWPDKPERAALHNLRTTLADLRSAIGDRDAAPPFLLITRETIQFNPISDHWLDVAAFQTLVETGEADQPVHQRLEKAIALYQGELLTGFSVRDSSQFEDWVLLLRERLHWQALEALDALAAYHEGREEYQEAIACARRQVALEPWQEKAHRQLMRLLALSGHRGAALAQYETCRQVLAGELGVEPEAETAALHEQIRAGALAPPAKPPVDRAAAPPPAAVPAPEEAPCPLPPILGQGVPEGERRIVTVVQAEVSRSTAPLSGVDNEDWAAFVGQFLRTAGTEVHRLGGEVDRYDPEGLVALFGARAAHEDDPERAVLAALAMQAVFQALLAELGQFAEGETGWEASDDPALRVGVHTGEAIVTLVGGDSGHRRSVVMGDVISSANRVLALVPSGEVCVSEATQQLVEPLFEWDLGEKSSCPLGHRVLLSKGRGVEGLESPLVGRDAELRALQEAVARLRDGIGGIVTVVGEAGIGKSRLVAEVRRTADGQLTAADRRSWTDDRQPQTVDQRSSERRVDSALRHSQGQPTGCDAKQGEGLTADRGLSWVEGRCLSYATNVAYQMWVDTLRGLLSLEADALPEAAAQALRERVHALCADRADEVHPFLAQMMSLPLTASAEARVRGIEGEGLQVLTFRAVEMLVACATQREPLVLACEDLHWADPTSLALLEHLLPLTDRIRLLVICVHRPEKDHGCWRIKETADRLYGHRHTDLWLGPLSADESAQLVGNLLNIEDLPGALRSRILDRAEGNPFYVEEILRSLIDEGTIAYDGFSGRWQAVREVSELALPDTLRGLLVARIDRLPRKTRQVLQLASVVGRIFTYPVLAAVAGSPASVQGEAGKGVLDTHLVAHLVALERAQMVRQRSRVPEATYAFKHQLTLEAAYEGLLRRKRRVLHRRVAEVLERLLPEHVEEQPGLLAHHWECAGETERAISYLRRAGERAAAQFANAEAVAYFSRALDLLPEESADRYALLLAREWVYDLQGDREAQDRDLATLERLTEAHGDNAERAEVAVRRARYLHRIDENAQAASAAQAAVRLAQAAQDVRSEAMAYREWGRALRGDREEKQRHLERALALARDAGLGHIEADILHTLGSVLGILTEGGIACWEQGLRICREIGDRRREGEALCDVGGALLYRCDWAEGEGYLRQALNVFRETGNRRDEAWALRFLGIISHYQGHYARSRSEFEQGLRICREVRGRLEEGEVLYGLGRVYTDLFDYAIARDYLEQGLRIYRERNSRVDEGWGLVYLGLVFHLQGDYASAGTCYGQALHVGGETDNCQVDARALMYMGLLSHHLGDDRAARAYSQQALRIIPDLDTVYAVDLIDVFAVLGHALARLGHPAEAADAYWQGLTLRREKGQHHLAVEPLTGLARVSLAQGDPAGALAHVGEILDYMEDHPALLGTLEPLRIYSTCYRVLLANGDPRAEEILHAAYHLLQERAAAIEDQSLRRSYLENVPAHREIVATWKETSHR